MAKIRASIYIDEATWAHIKDEAWRMRISASAFIAKIIRGEICSTLHVSREEVSESLEAAVDGFKEVVKEDLGIRPYSKAEQVGKKKGGGK